MSEPLNHLGQTIAMIRRMKGYSQPVFIYLIDVPFEVYQKFEAYYRPDQSHEIATLFLNAGFTRRIVAQRACLALDIDYEKFIAEYNQFIAKLLNDTDEEGLFEEAWNKAQRITNEFLAKVRLNP